MPDRSRYVALACPRMRHILLITPPLLGIGAHDHRASLHHDAPAMNPTSNNVGKIMTICTPLTLFPPQAEGH